MCMRATLESAFWLVMASRIEWRSWVNEAWLGGDVAYSADQNNVIPREYTNICRREEDIKVFKWSVHVW